MPGPFEIAGLPTSESLSEPPITFTLNPDGTWTDLTDYTFGPPAEITGPQYTYEDARSSFTPQRATRCSLTRCS